MNGNTPLDDALDAAIDRLRAGETLDHVLAGLGDRSTEAARLLETVGALGAIPPVPAPTGLADNYVVVKAALERAQMADTAGAAPRHWWHRRFSVASLSVPAGVAAAVFALGVTGAAASMLTAGAGSVVADLLPSWVDDVVPGGKSGDAPGREHNVPPANEDNPASPGGDAPGADNRPTFLELVGLVSDVNGNTFTLTTGDGTWKVNIDANTEVTGEILEGADAEVAGDVTAEKNLHATAVSASGGEPAVAPGNSDGDRGPGAKPTPTADTDESIVPESPGNPNPGDGTPGRPQR